MPWWNTGWRTWRRQRPGPIRSARVWPRNVSKPRRKCCACERSWGRRRAMLADRLYERFGRPDYCIAQHDNPEIAASQVGVVAGPMLAGANTVDVIVRGVGGHGARPEATKDPVVMAAQFVLALQTIVIRQTAPQDPAVVTVGSIHGGTRPNIIPDEVKLQISTRAFSEEVRRDTDANG